MAYRIRLLVPSAYADEARVMLEEHPRAAVVERITDGYQPGADLLVVVIFDLAIIPGLWRWWMPHRFEARAQPPLSLITADGTVIPFDQHSPEELLALAAQEGAIDLKPPISDQSHE